MKINNSNHPDQIERETREEVRNQSTKIRIKFKLKNQKFNKYRLRHQLLC